VLSVIAVPSPYTPPDDVAELKAIGPRVTPVVYPDAEHGFVHDASRPSHRADDAADAWQRTATFLA
jgi:carboxymethylenebutenolidase